MPHIRRYFTSTFSSFFRGFKRERWNRILWDLYSWFRTYKTWYFRRSLRHTIFEKTQEPGCRIPRTPRSS
jgi:hypothetical protein